MKKIGLVEEIEFHVYKGKTFAFDVLWWTDAAKTVPAVITSARGKIKNKGGTGTATIVDLAPTFSGNRVSIHLSPAQTLAIPDRTGVLEIEASTSSETKILARGRVIFYPEISE